MKWEYVVVPLDDAKGIKKGTTLSPERLNALGDEGWEAVGVTLKAGDLVAWPVVLMRREVVG